MSTQYIIILVTTGSKKEAEEITRILLEEKLIACANIVGPVTSHFHWQGKINKAEELLVLMKSRLDLFDKLTARIKVLHSYDIPEILALPVVAGSKGYLDWLSDSLS